VGVQDRLADPSAPPSMRRLSDCPGAVPSGVPALGMIRRDDLMSVHRHPGPSAHRSLAMPPCEDREFPVAYHGPVSYTLPIATSCGRRAGTSLSGRSAKGEEMESRLFSDAELMNAYQKAVHDYDAAKTGTGCRVKMFTSFLVAERVLTSRLGTAGGATVGARSS
jgi:hypothetical protein